MTTMIIDAPKWCKANMSSDRETKRKRIESEERRSNNSIPRKAHKKPYKREKQDYRGSYRGRYND